MKKLAFVFCAVLLSNHSFAKYGDRPLDQEHSNFEVIVTDPIIEGYQTFKLSRQGLYSAEFLTQQLDAAQNFERISVEVNDAEVFKRALYFALYNDIEILDDPIFERAEKILELETICKTYGPQRLLAQMQQKFAPRPEGSVAIEMVNFAVPDVAQLPDDIEMPLLPAAQEPEPYFCSVQAVYQVDRWFSKKTGAIHWALDEFAFGPRKAIRGNNVNELFESSILTGIENGARNGIMFIDVSPVVLAPDFLLGVGETETPGPGGLMSYRLPEGAVGVQLPVMVSMTAGVFETYGKVAGGLAGLLVGTTKMPLVDDQTPSEVLSDSCRAGAKVGSKIFGQIGYPLGLACGLAKTATRVPTMLIKVTFATIGGTIGGVYGLLFSPCRVARARR